jgi:hypothetical protein
MAFGRGPNIVTDGLVLCLDAASHKSYPGSGTTWYDLSGDGNTGTLTNGPTFSDNSLVFDGTNDYVSVSGVSSPVGVSDFSVESWIKLESIPSGNPRVVAIGSDSNNYFNLATYGGGSPGTYDTFWFEIKKAGTLYGGFHSSARKYETGKWYNLVGTFINSTNTPKFYINGISVAGSGVSGGAPSVFNTLLIATGTTTPSEVIDGYIPLVKLYNKTLTDSEIQQNYNATKSRFGL